MKHCKKCDKIKPRSEFFTARGKANGLNAHCKPCWQDKWREAPPSERFRARNYKFGITREEYLHKLETQNARCAICGEPETDIHRGTLRTLSIDHCHSTNKVRDLLCGRCNKAIGLMLDDPVRLRAAADYVERWAAALCA
ncbi:endonuclease VII domain-containing protein [Mycobacterium sp. CVI_P3]|uniref:endonuclease VII domain-containing protein n=1 Tax=Mycobacterium pinniadriaticum TaxID=2994102 RepID=UPI0022495CC3|nr:endonuclease VII domain-containing protein [Mycobacterium pinniadriaticum]MCX2931410.1 endonuclease VII domain-containing protein [Mycobacterium pinniadriaticum]